MLQSNWPITRYKLVGKSCTHATDGTINTCTLRKHFWMIMDIPYCLSFFPFLDWLGNVLSCWMNQCKGGWQNPVDHSLTSLQFAAELSQIFMSYTSNQFPYHLCFTDTTRHSQCNPMKVEFPGSLNFFVRVWVMGCLFSVMVDHCFVPGYKTHIF